MSKETISKFDDIFNFKIGQLVWILDKKLIQCRVDVRDFVVFTDGTTTISYTLVDRENKYYRVDESVVFETVGLLFKSNCSIFDPNIKPENIYFYSA